MDKDKFSEAEIKRLIHAAEFGRQGNCAIWVFVVGMFILGGASDYLKTHGLFDQLGNLFFVIFMLFAIIFLVFVMYSNIFQYVLKCPYCNQNFGVRHVKFLLKSKRCKYCNEILIADGDQP